ncbi:MAG: trypsin-like serine protease, partial [Elusimicrobiaceae bacterium]|nr:trypsin-like serine protease [Elusimicrobiaceae bacterium]
MQKTYILIFLLLSIPIPSLCDEINDWLFYDVKTQTTTEITLPEDVTTNPISAPNNLIEITGTANKYQKPAVTLMFSQSEKETPGIRKDYLCSGALVGQNIVLTAAHCTMDKKKMFVDNIEIFAPGVTDLPHAQSTKIIIPKQYETGIIVDSKEYKEYDYAFILLDTPLGERLGYFGTKRYFIPRLLHKKIQ